MKKALFVICAIGLAAQSAVAGPNTGNVTQLGSVLAFPYVTTKTSQTTVVRLINANNNNTTVACKYADRNGTTSATFALTAQNRRPVIVPAANFTAGSGEGLLICWATNGAVSTQVAWNFLSGTATIIDSTTPTRTWEYSAWSFAARQGLAEGTPVGVAGLIKLDGIEYDACPQYIIGQFSPGPSTVANTPTKGSLTFLANNVAVIPCNVNLVSPLAGASYLTAITIDIMNENGVAATGLVTCVGTWYEGALPNAPGFSMTNADAYRLQSLGGAAACPGKPAVGLIGVEVATLNVTPAAGVPRGEKDGSNLTLAGQRTGYIQWK